MTGWYYFVCKAPLKFQDDTVLVKSDGQRVVLIQKDGTEMPVRKVPWTWEDCMRFAAAGDWIRIDEPVAKHVLENAKAVARVVEMLFDRDYHGWVWQYADGDIDPFSLHVQPQQPIRTVPSCRRNANDGGAYVRIKIIDDLKGTTCTVASKECSGTRSSGM